MLFDDGVKHGVQIVQEGDDLKRRTFGGERREADDIAEEDGHLVERFGLDVRAFLELVSNIPARGCAELDIRGSGHAVDRLDCSRTAW